MSKPRNSHIKILSQQALTYLSNIRKSTIDVGERRIGYLESGEGDPIILIHGFDGSIDVWRLLMRSFTGKYRMIALEVPGMSFGSDLMLYESFSVQRAIQYILQAADALGIERFHVAGLSAGSTIVASMAIAHPDRILSTAFFSMPTLFKEADYINKSHDELVDFLIPNSLDGVELLLDYLFYRPPNLPSFIRGKFLKYSLNNRELRKEVLRSIILHNSLIVSRLSHLRLPCAVIYGSNDSALPQQTVDYLMNSIRNLVSYLVLDSGHFSVLESPKMAASFYHSFLNCVDDRTRLP